MAKKVRPKYITELVESVNEHLHISGVKNSDDRLFNWTCNYLLKKGYYQGYNFYIRKEVNGKEISVLAGTSDQTKYDYIQLY